MTMVSWLSHPFPTRSMAYPRPMPSLLQCVCMPIMAALAAAAPMAAAELPATPAAWRAAAGADIEAAVQVTRANHPGMHDPRNPAFLAHLEAAHRHGLQLASQVKDMAGYVAAVDGFNTRIGDGHAGLAVRIDKALLPKPRWPGFVAVWRGDGLYVHTATAGQPAPGSKLLACDGKPAEELIRTNVFAFQGRVAEAGQWWSDARNLFIDTHNPFVVRPRGCSFALDGKLTQHALAWRDIGPEAERLLAASSDGDARGVGMSEPRKNLYWMSMPTFHPDEAERNAYRAVNRGIVSDRARYLAADAVVVDLRKNGGGSSSWAREFARALWGAARVDAAMAAFSANTEVWWRASPGNTDYVAWMAGELDRQGQAEGAAWARTQAEGMRAALGRGAPFHVERRAADAGAAPAADAEPPFSQPLYVVVPGDCASACLDALDVFTRFPNTRLIGAPSSADSRYMEVRRENLASGLAAVRVPNKMYVNHGRTDGKVYQPDIPVTAVAWTMQSLLEVVERDLAARQAR